MRVDYRVLSLLALLASCGGDDTTAGADSVPIGHLRGEFVAANCDFLVRCGFEPDFRTCRRVDFAPSSLLQLIADSSTGKAHYDGAAAMKWIDAVRSERCALHSTAVERAVRDAWKPVFTGTIADGGPCFADDECRSGLLCDKSACMGEACCAGKCAGDPGPIAIGQPCDDSKPCVVGAVCADGQCITPADNGEDCSSLSGCKDDQLCDMGKCYKLAGTGGKCEPTLEFPCAGFEQFCNEKSVCARLPGDGKPCANGTTCLQYAVCGMDALCHRRPTLGEPCDDMNRCLGDLNCDNNLCDVPRIEICSGP